MCAAGFTRELPTECFDNDNNNNVFAIVTNITNRSEDFTLADMTTNLVIKMPGSVKMSKVTCKTNATASATLILAGYIIIIIVDILLNSIMIIL